MGQRQTARPVEVRHASATPSDGSGKHRRGLLPRQHQACHRGRDVTLDFLASAAADVAGHTSTTEAVLFWVLGTVAVAGAIGVVAAPKAVYSAMFLATTMIVLAVFYIAQDALFLGVVQIVVYTGAVMMLFLFVLMLIGVDLSESLVETIRGQRVSAIIAGVGFGVLLIAGIGNVSTAGFQGLAEANNNQNVEGLAALIFTRYLWAFELTGAL